MESKLYIFSKKKLKNSRDRVAIRNTGGHFLFNEINKRLTERLLLIKKKNFTILELGSRTGTTLKNLPKEKNIKKFFFTDISHKMLIKAKEKIIFNIEKNEMQKVNIPKYRNDSLNIDQSLLN